MDFLRIILLSTLTIFSANIIADQGDTLKNILERGSLVCGVSQGLPGFSNPDDDGNWTGLDVDYCRAIAAATLGDSSKVKFVPLSAKERFTALQSGEIDILSRNTTWTFLRDTTLGIDFVGVIFYDGQGFMVPTNLGVSKLKELNGATICTNSGTTTELNITDYFKSNNIDFQIVTFEKTDETVAAYESGRCDVYSTDGSGLAAQRLRLKEPNRHVILSERISKEPLAPAVRQGDDQWANIARWTLFVMINAEEYGINKQNVAKFYNNTNPNIRRLLDSDNSLGEKIGLQSGWSKKILQDVGSYSDIFDDNVGSKSPINLARGYNALWQDGGIMYAPPMR
jgi:general L-amino acid transport system substrate-binding protein